MNRVVKQTRDATINTLMARRMFRHCITYRSGIRTKLRTLNMQAVQSSETPEQTIILHTLTPPQDRHSNLPN